LKDEEVCLLLLELIGDEHCLRIEEMFLNDHSRFLSDSSLNLISEKCINLKVIDLPQCKKISASAIEIFQLKLPNCDVFTTESWEDEEEEEE
jgi:predicted metalloenzyme YecM